MEKGETVGSAGYRTRWNPVINTGAINVKLSVMAGNAIGELVSTNTKMTEKRIMCVVSNVEHGYRLNRNG